VGTPSSAPSIIASVAPAGTRAPTPIPAEWANNYQNANGLVIGAVVLVVIIVGGTLGAIRRK
jgi:hypothetical protein